MATKILGLGGACVVLLLHARMGPPDRLWARDFALAPSSPEWIDLARRLGTQITGVRGTWVREVADDPETEWHVSGSVSGSIAVTPREPRVLGWLRQIGAAPRSAVPYRLLPMGDGTPEDPATDRWTMFACEQEALPSDGVFDRTFVGEWSLRSGLPWAGVLEDLENSDRTRSEAERWQGGTLRVDASGNASHSMFPGAQRKWCGKSGVLYMESFVSGSAPVTVAAHNGDRALRFAGRTIATRR